MGKEKLSRIRPKIEYDTIIRTAMDGFLLLDMDGYFIDVNDSYCQLIGYSRDELLNMGVRDVEAKEALEDIAACIEKVKKTGSHRFETKHRRKDGQILDIEVSATYVPKLRGQIVSFLRDITERKEAEKVIREQQEKLSRFSTPVLRAYEGLLVLPVVGLIDSKRVQQLTQNLLESIQVNRARVAVLDITGVPVMSSSIANHLIVTATAADLMGAKIIMTGLSGEIARTLAELGVDLSNITTVADLQSGIEMALKLLGQRVVLGDRAA